MPRRALTPAFVSRAKAAPGAERTVYWDPTLPRFGLVVTASGARSFVVQYRMGGRATKSRRMRIGREGEITLTDARKEARGLLADAGKGVDPLVRRRAAEHTEADSLEAVVQEYLRRRDQLRSIGDARRVFRKHVLPTLGKRQIADIGRKDIVRLLDGIQDGSGARMSDAVLGRLRTLFNWHAARDETFRSPIVRGMARTKPKERARQRTLTDDELRAVWQAGATVGYPFGTLVQYLLLTATRRTEAAGMTRSERHGEGGRAWIIPGARYKTGSDFLLPLSDQAAALLDALPVIGRHGFVFTRSGDNHLTGYSKAKAGFDKVCGVRGWRLHDLRRTARSLMSRAGVDPDHAERALGHALPAIRGTYDLHSYEAEKRAAFQALAAQLRMIIAGQPANGQPRQAPRV